MILINRGWVPSDKLQTESRRFAQIEGPVSFDAIVRVSENVYILLIFIYFLNEDLPFAFNRSEIVTKKYKKNTNGAKDLSSFAKIYDRETSLIKAMSALLTLLI